MKIILVGMMGSGKSAIAKILSQELNIKLFECDEIFEKKFNIQIKDYFAKYGEEKFRLEETKILDELVKKDEFVISTGGGAVTKAKNRDLIFENSEIISIYIETNPNVIYERIKNDKTRPLLQKENPKEEIIKILSDRELYYRQARYVVSNNKQIYETVEEIKKCLTL